MAVIDESRITLPIKCIPLPVKYQAIPVLGLSCQLESKSGLVRKFLYLFIYFFFLFLILNNWFAIFFKTFNFLI